MSDKDLQEYLDFAKDLALSAGPIMKKYFRSETAGVKAKDDKTLVTLADTEINKLVIEKIKQRFPTHAVHGEEESLEVKGAAYTWVCDPVDGTMQFAKGLPVSTFALALVNKEGIALLGVVYDPFEDRLFEAQRGAGAFLNGKKIEVSKLGTLDNAYIDNELWVNELEGISFDDPRDMLAKKGAKVTSICSAVIMGCLVAQGTFDAMLFGQSKPEDIAALSVIVEEAGGKVTNIRGEDQRYDRKIYGAIVSNSHIHSQLVEALDQINYTSKYVKL